MDDRLEGATATATAWEPVDAGDDAPVRDEGALLLARHVAGDRAAFAELIATFGPAVNGYLRRSGLPPQTADDLFQETFLRVHQSARRFDGSRPFRAWLFTIAGNLVRSQLRKQRVRRVMTSWWRRSRDDADAFEAIDPPDPTPGAERLAAARERMTWLEGALSDLKDDVRQALLLTQVQGLPYEDAAAALGVPVATVKTRVRRGRLALAESLALVEGSGTP